METISAFDAKTRFGELLKRVAQGEELVITRHDKPVARLIPEGTPPLAEIRAAVEGLRCLRQQIQQRPTTDISDDDVCSAIAEGRL